MPLMRQVDARKSVSEPDNCDMPSRACSITSVREQDVRPAASAEIRHVDVPLGNSLSDQLPSVGPHKIQEASFPIASCSTHWTDEALCIRNVSAKRIEHKPIHLIAAPPDCRAQRSYHAGGVRTAVGMHQSQDFSCNPFDGASPPRMDGSGYSADRIHDKDRDTIRRPYSRIEVGDPRDDRVRKRWRRGDRIQDCDVVTVNLPTSADSPWVHSELTPEGRQIPFNVFTCIPLNHRKIESVERRWRTSSRSQGECHYRRVRLDLRNDQRHVPVGPMVTADRARCDRGPGGR
jgi:hypothetical protein